MRCEKTASCNMSVSFLNKSEKKNSNIIDKPILYQEAHTSSQYAKQYLGSSALHREE